MRTFIVGNKVRALVLGESGDAELCTVRAVDGDGQPTELLDRHESTILRAGEFEILPRDSKAEEMEAATRIAARVILDIRPGYLREHSQRQVEYVLSAGGFDSTLVAEIRSPLGLSGEIRVSRGFYGDERIEVSASVPGQGSHNRARLEELHEVTRILLDAVKEIESEVAAAGAPCVSCGGERDVDPGGAVYCTECGR